MVGYLQSGLRMLTNSFCNVEVLEDTEGNIIVDRDGEPKLKTPNSRVLPYTCLMVWYVMHCPSLMSAVYASEDVSRSSICWSAQAGRVGTCMQSGLEQHELPAGQMLPQLPWSGIGRTIH